MKNLCYTGYFLFLPLEINLSITKWKFSFRCWVFLSMCTQISCTTSIFEVRHLREHLCSCLQSSILASVSSTEDYGLLKKGRGLGRPENGMECKSCSRPLVDNENSPQLFRPDKSIAVPLSFPSAYLCLTICRSRARTMARIC